MIIIWVVMSVAGLIIVAVILAVSASRRRSEGRPYGDSSYTSTSYDRRYRPPDRETYYQPVQPRVGSRGAALAITLVAVGLLLLGGLFAYFMLQRGGM